MGESIDFTCINCHRHGLRYTLIGGRCPGCNYEVDPVVRRTVKPQRSHPPDHVCRGCCNCGCHILGAIKACDKCRDSHWYKEELADKGE